VGGKNKHLAREIHDARNDSGDCLSVTGNRGSYNKEEEFWKPAS
jgi:hypothetical protein